MTMPFLKKLRLRVLAILVAGGLAAIGLLSVVSLPALPVLGVAVITVAAVVHRVTARLSLPTCHGCGEDLTDVPGDSIGVVCPGCGAVNQPLPPLAQRRRHA